MFYPLVDKVMKSLAADYYIFVEEGSLGTPLVTQQAGKQTKWPPLGQRGDSCVSYRVWFNPTAGDAIDTRIKVEDEICFFADMAAMARGTISCYVLSRLAHDDMSIGISKDSVEYCVKCLAGYILESAGENKILKPTSVKAAYQLNKTLAHCCCCGRETETRQLFTGTVQYCACIEKLETQETA
jgi:hypothetical protein